MLGFGLLGCHHHMWIVIFPSLPVKKVFFIIGESRFLVQQNFQGCWRFPTQRYVRSILVDPWVPLQCVVTMTGASLFVPVSMTPILPVWSNCVALRSFSVVGVPVISLHLPLSQFRCYRTFFSEALCFVAITQSLVVNTVMPFSPEVCWVKHHYHVASQCVLLSRYVTEFRSVSSFNSVVSSALLTSGLTTRSSCWVRGTIISSQWFKKLFGWNKCLSGIPDQLVVSETRETDPFEIIVACNFGWLVLIKFENFDNIHKI